MKGFTPLQDLTLLKPVVPEKIGRFWIPDVAKGKAMEAVVVAVGQGRLTSKGVRIPTGLKPGDRVFVRYYHEAAIEIDGEKYMMLPAEREIIGVLEGEE